MAAVTRASGFPALGSSVRGGIGSSFAAALLGSIGSRGRFGLSGPGPLLVLLLLVDEALCVGKLIA